MRRDVAQGEDGEALHDDTNEQRIPCSNTSKRNSSRRYSVKPAARNGIGVPAPSLWIFEIVAQTQNHVGMMQKDTGR